VREYWVVDLAARVTHVHRLDGGWPETPPTPFEAALAAAFAPSVLVRFAESGVLSGLTPNRQAIPDGAQRRSWVWWAAARSARAFLSFKREERDRVRAIASALEAKRHKVWWDPQLQPQDVSYQRQSKRESAEAQACIVALSIVSVESDFVISEAEMARAQKKLVCVLLDHDCAPPPLNTMQRVDLPDWQGMVGIRSGGGCWEV